MNIIVPVDVCIKRYYRAYANVDENATEKEILKTITDAIIENQESELMPDPVLDIDEIDIEWMHIDHDGAWTQEEDKDINEILKGK